MAKLTTGPFIIPRQLESGQNIDNLVVNLVNKANTRKTVTVTVERARQAFFPNKRREEVIAQQQITLGANQSTIFLVPRGRNTFNRFDTLQVTISGDVKQTNNQNKGIEAWITTGFDGGPFEPTNLFRHSDLFRTK